MKRTIGKNIKYWREKRGLSQGELGRYAFGYSITDQDKAYQRIKRLENTQEPKLSEAAQIAKVLKINICALLKHCPKVPKSSCNLRIIK